LGWGQVTDEIRGLFDFLQHVYGTFGFTFKLRLSTRPEKFLGDVKTWDVAEQKLRDALDSFTAAGGARWELNEGDGAFYGPKIDITISDALRREHQCATIQLDFQLPQQFRLEYMTAEGTGAAKPKPAEAADKAAGEVANDAAGGAADASAGGGGGGGDDAARQATATAGTRTVVAASAAATDANTLTPGCARPVMIHRAIYGSFERFIAILTEHFAGKWPFWLSPRQILVVPVMPAANDYVVEVQQIFRAQGMHVDIDISGNTMQKKIRTGQLQQYNFIFGEFVRSSIIAPLPSPALSFSPLHSRPCCSFDLKLLLLIRCLLQSLVPRSSRRAR
jgi:threonyl-tRNA synthetase